MDPRNIIGKVWRSPSCNLKFTPTSYDKIKDIYLGVTHRSGANYLDFWRMSGDWEIDYKLTANLEIDTALEE
jgi:hypothetical protein